MEVRVSREKMSWWTWDKGGREERSGLGHEILQDEICIMAKKDVGSKEIPDLGCSESHSLKQNLDRFLAFPQRLEEQIWLH